MCHFLCANFQCATLSLISDTAPPGSIRDRESTSFDGVAFPPTSAVPASFENESYFNVTRTQLMLLLKKKMNSREKRKEENMILVLAIKAVPHNRFMKLLDCHKVNT